jgi:hypothetical protein
LNSVNAAASTEDEMQELVPEPRTGEEYTGDWRTTDRELFYELIEDTHIRSDGKGRWTKGTATAEKMYTVLRKRTLKRINWPGRYLQMLDGAEGIDDFLIDEGIETYTPEESRR